MMKKLAFLLFLFCCSFVHAQSTQMDGYCTTGNVCSFGGTDSYATLPTTGYYTDPSVWFTPGTVRHATTAATLTTALAAMQCGDTLSLDANIQGQFTLPALHCDATHYWRITGFGRASLPGYGTPISPCYAGVQSLPGYVNPDGSSVYPCTTPVNQMPVMTSTGSNGTGAFWTVPNAGMSYGIIDSTVYTRTAGSGRLTDLLLDTSTGGQWDHVIVYHNWCEGTTQDESNRCLVLNRGTFIAVINNFGSELHCISGIGACTDAKFVGGGTNTNAGDTDHAWKIVGNVAASAGQAVLFGGGSAAMIPSDVEIRLNWWFKPPSWNPSCTVALCGAAYNGGVSGHAFVVKNCEENKTGDKFFYEANRCTNGWPGFSQVGNAITITPKNQSGTLCPICAVTNLVHRWELVESYWQILQISNVSDGSGTYANGGNHYSIHDVLGTNIQAPQTNPAGSCCNASMMTLNNDFNATTIDILHHVDVNHVGIIPYGGGTGSGAYSSYILGAGAALNPNQNTNIKWHNNYFPVGYFGGFTSSSGTNPSSCASSQTDATGVISACWSGNSVGGNMILPPIVLRSGASSVAWPATTCSVVGGGGGLYGGLTGVQAFTQTFTNYQNGATTGDFHIVNSSPCHNAGDDGTDPGPNVTQLNLVMQAVGFSPTPPVVTGWTQVSTPSGATHIRNFAINTNNNHWYLADRVSGFWISTNQGASWSQINFGITSLTGWTITWDGAHNQLIAGTSGSAKFYRSSNEGANWTVIPQTNAGTSPAVTGSIISNNGNLIDGGLFGTAPTGGTFYSTNGGTSTSVAAYSANTNCPIPGGVWSLLENTITNDAWSGTEECGVYRSTNNGANWVPASPPDQNYTSGIFIGNVQGLTYDSSGNMLLSAQGGIWKASGSGGAYTWANVFSTGGAPNGRALGRDSGGNLYWGHNNGGLTANPVYRSTNGGTTWAPFSTGLPTGLEAWSFLQNPADGKVYVNLQNGSTNVGTIWAITGGGGGGGSRPSPPTNLTGVESASNEVLNWTQSATSGVDGNKIYRKTYPGSTFSVIFTSGSPINTYTDSSVAGTTTYFYNVTATCSTCTTTESLASNTIQGNILPIGTPQSPQVIGVK